MALLADPAPPPPRVTQELVAIGLKPCWLATAGEVLNRLDQDGAALLILEQVLPDMPGTELCQRVRSEPQHARLPVVFYSRLEAVADRIAGLEAGADDYVPKSCNPRELVLRLRRLFPRGEPDRTPQEVFRFGSLEIDLRTHGVRFGGRVRPVTLTEFRLLAALAVGRGRVLSREALLGEIRPGRDDLDPRSVDSHVRRLRAKLGAGRRHIRAVRGFGYRLE